MNRLAASRAKQPPPTRAVGVLQRQCACGAHTGGAACTACTGKPPSVQALARGGVAGSAGTLPYLDRIQESFGPRHDLTGIRAHSGGEAANAAARMGAQAYAFGDRVAFAGPPSLHTAAHEAAHVIQQRAGVRPAGGVGQVGDHHERQADAVAARVVQGRSSVDLLAPFTPARTVFPEVSAVQMEAQNTSWGKMIDAKYDVVGIKPEQTPEENEGPAPPPAGVRLKLEFEPGGAVDATKIALTQSVRTTSGDLPFYSNLSQRSRMVTEGSAKGYRLDREGKINNPIFGAPALAEGEELTDTPTTNMPPEDLRKYDDKFAKDDVSATYVIGYRYYDRGTLVRQNAVLDDPPTWAPPGRRTSMTFETTAVSLEGRRRGIYYGSVKWGYERDASGVVKKLDFQKVSDGTPTANFSAAAEKWNTATIGEKWITEPDTQFFRQEPGKLKASFKVADAVMVTPLGTKPTRSDVYAMVKIDDQATPVVPEDPDKSVSPGEKEGYVNVEDLSGQGDGKPTVDVPLPSAEANQEALDTAARSFSGIIDVTGRDPTSLTRLDAVTVVELGGTDGDSMAMRTDLSDLFTELAGTPRRIDLHVFSINPAVKENQEVAGRIKKQTGQEGTPQTLVYVEDELVKTFQGYKASYKLDLRRIVKGAASRGTVSGLKWGALIGGIAGGAIGAVTGAALGAQSSNPVLGGLIGGVAGLAIGGAAGSAIGLVTGAIAGTDSGRSQLSAEEVKRVESFLTRDAPMALDHSFSIQIVDYWVENLGVVALDIEDRRLLINNLVEGPTGDYEERAIIKIIENSSDEDLLRIFSLDPDKPPNLLTLEDEFQGSEKTYLRQVLDRLRDRFPVNAPSQQTEGLLIDNHDVQVKLKVAFEETHKEPLVAREYGGVFLKKGDKIEHRGELKVGTDADVGGISKAAKEEPELKGFDVIATYHTHPRTVPPTRGATKISDYPKSAREAPSSDDFKTFLQAPERARGKEHYVIGPFVTYLILRDGSLRILGNTADLLKVRRFEPQAGQKSTLELG